MELYELPMIEVSEKIRTNEVSPVEVTQSSLARLEEVEPRLTAFATSTPELALEQAKIAEKEISEGNYRGPLHGVPLAVKDLYDTAGVPTTSSSAQRAHYVPDTDSVSVAKLYEAGMGHDASAGWLRLGALTLALGGVIALLINRRLPL